jgi:hypothetical protein
MTRLSSIFFLCLCASALNSRAQTPSCPSSLDSGMGYFWPFDSITATHSPEIVSGNYFVMVNSPTVGAGQITNAVAFDGLTQSGATTGNIATASSGKLTISFWLKSTQSTGTGVIAELSPNFGSPGNSFAVFVNDQVAGAIECADANGTPLFNIGEMENTSWYDGNWHFIVFIAQRGGSSEWTAYFDGQPFSLTQLGSPYNTAITAAAWAAQPLYLGARDNTSLHTAMSIDNLTLSSTVPTPAQVLQEYNDGVECHTPYFVASWPAPGKYYVDYGSGSDFNDGLTKSTAWKTHPYMSGYGGSYVHTPGDHFIFKGAVTWPITFMQPLAGGVAGNSDYYGVDSNWFAGSSFTRPVWDGGHVETTIVYIGPGITNIDFDSIEVRAIACNADDQGLFAFNQTHDITGTNLWLHDWLNYSSAPGTDSGHGGWVWNTGNSGYIITNMILANSEVDNIENGASGKWNGNCIIFGGRLVNCLIHDNNSTITFAQDVDHCTIWDVDWPYTCFDPGEHCNALYLDNGTGNSTPVNGVSLYFRNSIMHDVGNAAEMAYPNVEKFDCYLYNDLYYGVMPSSQAIAIDTYNFNNPGATVKSCYIYNNTIILTNQAWTTGIVPAQRVGSDSQPILINNLWVTNNLFIGASAAVPTFTAGTYIANGECGHNLAETSQSAALLDGNFIPLTGSPALAAGANLTPQFTTDLTGATRPTAWSVGAYEFPPAPPGLVIQGGGTIVIQGNPSSTNVIQGKP